jgi:hypothetical protein
MEKCTDAVVAIIGNGARPAGQTVAPRALPTTTCLTFSFESASDRALAGRTRTTGTPSDGEYISPAGSGRSSFANILLINLDGEPYSFDRAT